MLKNYLKIALRNLVRFKVFTLINILGLSIGLSCCILISLYVQDELSYDRFHEKRDRIYRIVEEISEEGKLRYWSRTPAPLAPALINEYPEDFQLTRFAGGFGGDDVITYGNIQTRKNLFLYADPNVFEVFTIPLIKGNTRTVLNDPYSVVISEKLAHKYFGDKDPIGNILRFGHEGSYQCDYKVTGVFKNLPKNSTLQFDCLASFNSIYFELKEGNVSWNSSNYDTYVLLPKGYSPGLLESKLPQIVEKYNSDQEITRTKYRLQHLTDIYLNLEPGYELPTQKDNSVIFVFTGVALLILLVACINFMNLTTARASIREKEVGIRKVVGANRFQLARQFLSESVLLSLIACMLSIPIVELLLPVFNSFADKELIFLKHNNVFFWTALIVLSIVVGILAGSYPALFISSFKPVSILKGRLFNDKTNTKAGLRKILVVSQFVIAIIFIASTMIMHNQLRYMLNENLGYNKEHLVVIPISDPKIKPKYNLYKTEILRNHNILNLTATSYLPSERSNYQNVKFKGEAENFIGMINWISVDNNFIKTMGIKLILGKDFPEEYSSTSAPAYILNETALKQIGWKNPLGEQMDIIGWGQVSGVIKDFNFQSLHNNIQPMALCVYPEIFQYLLVRIKQDNISSSISFLENQWEEIYPGQTFEYHFYDEDFDKLYKSEIRLSSIFNFITILAFIVACLGLFGLVHYSTERRSKEIGIRKVLGASIPDILIMIAKDFVKWIVIANVIAFPVVYYIMTKWLQDFAYRINIGLWTFILSGSIALLIALITISFQSIKAAIANPVDSLKYE